MTKNLFKTLGLIGISIFMLTGCGDGETTVTDIQKPKVIEKTQEQKAVKIETHAAKQLPTGKSFNLNDVFKDAVKLAPNGKYEITIFEAQDDPYSAKLENDIYNSKELKDRLKNEFTTFSLDAKNNRMHKLQHEGKDLDVDTKTLLGIYNVKATPTLIFSDKKGKSIFVVPGYMPTKQFLVTLDFVKEQKWLGLNRKNGDVYKALKNYYLNHGIDVSKKIKK
ncbi:MAG: thioredoxin fold domain-containing protein [Epsilonproteobacteria bacterium]|nr:thioredoxin fold domain-containing protein [Campylobacterota bacterium]